MSENSPIALTGWSTYAALESLLVPVIDVLSHHTRTLGIKPAFPPRPERLPFTFLLQTFSIIANKTYPASVETELFLPLFSLSNIPPFCERTPLDASSAILY
jgi:hypothetical protein